MPNPPSATAATAAPSSAQAGAVLKAASTSALVNASLSALQIGLGIAAHSNGLFADGVHTLSDLAADAIVLIVLYVGARRASAKARRLDHATHDMPPDMRHDNAHANAAAREANASVESTVAALFIAALLIATGAQMLWQSVDPANTLSGSRALQYGALAVGGFVMLVKEALFRYLRAQARRSGSSALLASAWHARVDAISGLVATIGLAGGVAGLAIFDHLAGAAIGLLILRMGYATARDALRQLFAAANAPASRTAD